MKNSQLSGLVGGLAKGYYDEAKVLSENTGFIRDYNRDPYGSYAKGSGYYFNENLIFPVLFNDPQYKKKEVVLGSRVGEKPFSVLKSALSDKKIIEFVVDNQPLIAIYDELLETGRIFIRAYEDEILSFIYEDGSLRDTNTGTVWSNRGVALKGELEGMQLDMVNSYDVMWFAWFAFNPQTVIYE